MVKQNLIKYIEDGLSIRNIAAKEKISYTSAKYWLDKYVLKTKYRRSDQRTWSDADLKNAIKTSISKAEVLRKLGLSSRPGNYDTLNRHIKKLKISTAHFLGKAHGKTGEIVRKSLKEILVDNSSYKNNTCLKKRLVEKNLLNNECNICKLAPLWNEKSLVLVLDHINGKNDDYRIKNLRLLCPNCNSQQSTFCRK